MKFKLFKDFHSLAQFVFFVSLPAAILSNVPKPGFTLDVVSTVLLVVVPILAVGVVIYAHTIYSKKSFPAILIASLFGNIVYLGIPISQSYFPGTLDIVAFLIIITNLIIFVVVVPVATGARAKLVNPVLIAAGIAVILMTFGVDTTALSSALSPIASMTVPLSLIAMGMFAAQDLKLSFSKDVLTILFFKHIALPAATFLCVSFLAPDKIIGDLVMLSAIMSPAIANFSIVDSLKISKEKEIASAIILGIPIMLLEIWLLFG
jgi:predicted permease